MFIGLVDHKSNKKSKAVDSKTSDSLFTQIGQETEIEANIKTQKTIRIGGKVTGNVQSEEKIILSSKGELHGQCIAPIIEVSGIISGKIFAKKCLILNGSSRVKGEIFAKQFVVNEGAYIDGNITSGENIADIDKNIVFNNSSLIKTTEISSDKTSDEINLREQKNDLNKNNTAYFKKSKNKISEVTAEPIISGKGNNSSPNRIVSNVLLGIPGRDLNKTLVKEIKEAAGKFMEALGFTFEIYDEPTFDPFYQQLTYVMDRNNQQDKLSLTDIFNSGKSTLEDAFLGRKNEHEGENLFKSAISLKSSIKQVHELTITLGGIILVKTASKNGPIISAELISQDIYTQLKKNPKLVVQPADVYHSLNS